MRITFWTTSFLYIRVQGRLIKPFSFSAIKSRNRSAAMELPALFQRTKDCPVGFNGMIFFN
jgi:hypothetical protein